MKETHVMTNALVDFQNKLIAHIVQPDNTGAKLPAVEVYKNNFIENGIRALSISYPTLLNVLGESDFRRLAASYLASVTKIEFDWADFGAQMSDFILSSEVSQDLPYLSEIADFDWCRQMSERSKDTLFDTDSFMKLSSVAPSKVRFKVNESAKLVSYYFPMPLFLKLSTIPETNEYMEERKEILNALKNAINDAINLDEPRSYVVWKAEYKAEIEPIDVRSNYAFNAMLNRQSVEQVLSCFGESTEQMAAWIEDCIAKRLICAVEDITPC